MKRIDTLTLRLALGLAIGLTAPAGAAHADDLSATLGQPLAEVSHAVDVRIVDGIARYTVRRTFANSGVRADEAALAIDLPPGAAATGLRIRARDRWYSGDLMEAEAAREKYQELTGRGAWAPKDPALLQWVWADRLSLQVFPVFEGGANTVEYTLTAPLAYRDGRYLLAYPRPRGGPEEGALPLATPVLRVMPGYGDATLPVFIDGQRVIIDAPVVLRPPPTPPWYGDGEPSPTASYVHSKIPFEGLGEARAARINVEINHTYRGDLELELVTPGGARLAVTRGQGGDNDLRGEFTVELPPGTAPGGDWVLSVSDRAGLDVGTLERWTLALDHAAATANAPKWSPSRAASDLPLFIPDAPASAGDGGLALIEIMAPPIRTLAARLGRVVASPRSAFTRLEVDVAAQLRPLPRGASVVFVIDASRSLSPAALQKQLDVARAYVTHIPDAHVEIVLFRRSAERLFGAFVPAPSLAGALADAAARGRLARGNGSALEEGLRVAAEALQRRRGPLRIVLLSDARARARFTSEIGEAAAALAPPGAITHLVIPELTGAAADLIRDDAHTFAAIPASRGGVLYHLEVGEEIADKELAAGVLGLVRPVSIDNLAVDLGDPERLPELPSALREGEGLRVMVRRAAAPRSVVITGAIWSEPLRRVVQTTHAFDQATAAFVFSEDEHQDLTDAEMMRVALFGRAVSPVTSYLATEPGVRPSTIGLGGLGLLGTGHGGGGSGAGMVGGVSHLGKPWTLAELAAEGLAACKTAHPPVRGWSLDLEVETTSQEIVDILAKRSTSASLDRCVVEAIWQIELTWNFTDERATHPLTLR